MKRELPLMIGISAGLYFMAIDRKIGFVDGLLLFTGIIFFIGYQVYNTLNSKKELKNSTAGSPDSKTGIAGEYK